jgi:hypothetical protein
VQNLLPPESQDIPPVSQDLPNLQGGPEMDQEPAS